MPLRAYGERVVRGGIILCHDTEVERVGTDSNFPVLRAVKRYCTEAGHSFYERRGSFGMAVIEKG
jgi:hypothetical protein